MDTLNRIANTFNNIRYAVKNKKSSERVQCLKKEIHSLNTDLVVFGKENHEQFIRSIAMESYIALLTAKTMPISLAEKVNILQSSFEKLKQFALREECLFIFLRIQNLLCFYLIQTDKEARARDILECTETLYDSIGKSQPDKFLDAEDLFAPQPINSIKKINPEKVDKVITNNIQMQAFLYNKLNLHAKYTLYNHTALRRQLEMKDGTPQDWALRAARLGNYFTYLNDIPNARHHLCAAYHVLRNCHDNCKVLPEEIVLKKTDFEMHFLELGHHWIKYGLTLFKLSKKKILNKYFSPPSSKPNLWKTLDVMDETLSNAEASEEENIKDEGAEKSKKNYSSATEEFRFPSLNLEEMENGVPRNTVSTVEEARKLFSFTHKWLMRTKHYYNFEHHSAQYISCTLQLAELYEHLAFFEKNIDNQYSIQKRRADVLEILNSLLKTCGNVMPVQIDVIRELSQVQLELMALNLQKLWREESHTNLFNMDSDADSIINSLDSESKKTLTTGRNRGSSCKDLFLRKMEAATSINGKLFRLSSQLEAHTPSQVSLPTSCTKC